MPVFATDFTFELVLPMHFPIILRAVESVYHISVFPKSNSLLTTRKKIKETRQANEARVFTGRGMLFFIAGIQPKTVKLDAQPRMCPKCGLHQAYLKRVDHYLSLFFIPLFPVKQGDLFLECERCAGAVAESGHSRYEPPQKGSRACPSCGQPMDPSYRYCPSCGQRVR